jgi:hypothetical protein
MLSTIKTSSNLEETAISNQWKAVAEVLPLLSHKLLASAIGPGH